MNEQLQDAFDNIYNAKIPASWKRYSWESSTLGFWFAELLARDVQFKAWCFEVMHSSYFKFYFNASYY